MLFAIKANAQDSLLTTLRFMSGLPIQNGVMSMPITLGNAVSGGFSFDNYELHISFDTTVKNEGKCIAHCNHEWVGEITKRSLFSCAVYHGAAGCPDNWLKQNSICRICLKKIYVEELRYTKPKVDEYQQLEEQLKNLKPCGNH